MKHRLLPRGTTYQQRAVVRGMTPEELHVTVETWLRYSSCTIRESTPPKSIKAYFPANSTMLQLGLRDMNPKNVEVNISTFGNSAVMNITFTQEIPRMGEAGFLYWGDRLEQLYRELGVPLDPYTLTQLYPTQWVHRVIRRTLNLYAAFMLVSVAIVVLGLDLNPDLVATYFFVVVLPGTFMAGMELNDHRNLLRKTGNK
ncbi:MAG: hypothetical protein ABIJ47_11435 [Candidatus Bathyarchaeota archaeon]